MTARSMGRHVAAAAVAAMLCMLASAAVAGAAVQARIYASPTGTGTACSATTACTLDQARTKVRTINGAMTGDIRVLLRGGTYDVSGAPFMLTESVSEHDSGTNGHTIEWRNAPGETPVLSGGRAVTAPWTLFDAAKGIYRANVGTAIDTRQLYVNGQRAVRARGQLNPSGFTRTATGWDGITSSMASWGSKGRIEIHGRTGWIPQRCRVSTIVATTITMQEPCWTNANADLGWPSIAWIENAYELLDAAGEWYLGSHSGLPLLQATSRRIDEYSHRDDPDGGSAAADGRDRRVAAA